MLILLRLLACTDGASSAEDPVKHPRDDSGGGPGDSEDSGDTTACTFGAVVTADDTIGPLPLSASFGLSTRCAPAAWTTTWDFGDGGTAEGDSPSHTWLASGDFVVTAHLEGEDAATDATTRVRVTPEACPEVDEVTQVGTLQNAALVEASGLVQTPDGLLWSHNDSGDVARLFAMDTDGTDRGSFTLDGAPDGDWEDLAVDLLEDPPVLYAGDIGQNGGARATSTIYRVPEPTTATVSDWTSFELVFPDGNALDANTMLLDPVSGDLWLVADEGGGTYGVYRADAPFADGDLAPLTRVTGATLTTVPTGGSFGPLGDQLAVRTLDEAWLYRRDQAQPDDAVWSGAACPLPLGDEPAGEAITLTEDGYFTTGEALNHPIFHSGFLPAADPCDGTSVGITIDAASFALPFSPTFSIDETCLLAGVDAVRWDLGDGDTATGLSASKTWLASGTYEVSAQVTDGDGVVYAASTTFSVVGADCPTPGTTETWGTLQNTDIIEASGLAEGLAQAGVLWTHNDSGDTPRLFAVGPDGADLGEYAVETDNTDWEDIAIGWDATLDGPAIYVGDFGDNGEDRDHVAVLVVPEPIVDPDAPVEETIPTFSTLTLLYPDGAHNAETLMVDPVTGDLYVVTKDIDGLSQVFRKPAPHVDGSETELELVADLTFGVDPLTGSARTTAGDFSPLGDRIAIRTYDHAWMWRRDQAFTIAHAFAGDPCDLGAPSESQGEALAFTRDGAGYLTVSEGATPPLYFTPLR